MAKNYHDKIKDFIGESIKKAKELIKEKSIVVWILVIVLVLSLAIYFGYKSNKNDDII
jgi:uncharacterized protein YvpB